MKFLLDTNVLLWFVAGDSELPTTYQEAISNPENTPLISSISVAGIAIKHSIGKLPLPDKPQSFLPGVLRQLNILSLPFDSASALQLSTLPFHHRDPFDRMWICQARSAGIPFAATDKQIRRYDVEIL